VVTPGEAWLVAKFTCTAATSAVPGMAAAVAWRRP
jgi:hypothetical protein